MFDMIDKFSYISKNNFRKYAKMNSLLKNIEIRKKESSLHTFINIHPISITNLLGIIIISLLSIILIG